MFIHVKPITELFPYDPVDAVAGKPCQTISSEQYMRRTYMSLVSYQGSILVPINVIDMYPPYSHIGQFALMAI